MRTENEIITLEHLSENNRSIKRGNATYKICAYMGDVWYILALYNNGSDYGQARSKQIPKTEDVISAINSIKTDSIFDEIKRINDEY